MYTPASRLLTVLELLQASGSLSGAELARRLEVDPRSVRRYVVMLQDLGIPVEGARGPGGGYRLRPGYKLPPLMLTDDEAVAVCLGLRSLPRLGLRLPPETATGAAAKIERVLPDPLRRRVRAMQNGVALEAPPAPHRAGSARPAPLRAHATGRLACDSFAVETLRPQVLCVRFFGGVGTQQVVLAGGTAPPTAAWVTQQARDLTRALDAAGVRPAVLRHDHSNPRRPHGALRLDPPERPARAPQPPAPAPAVVRRDRRGGLLHDDEAAAA